jgi:hypothetical protein
MNSDDEDEAEPILLPSNAYADDDLDDDDLPEEEPLSVALQPDPKRARLDGGATGPIASQPAARIAPGAYASMPKVAVLPTVMQEEQRLQQLQQQARQLGVERAVHPALEGRVPRLAWTG